MLINDKITIDIAQDGLSVLWVPKQSGAACFAYTVGLSPIFNFELLVVGLPRRESAYVFGHIRRCGRAPDLGVPTTMFTNAPVIFKRCDLDKDLLHRYYVGGADRYYQTPVKVVQMILPDAHGRLPNDPAFDHAGMEGRQRLFCTL